MSYSYKHNHDLGSTAMILGRIQEQASELSKSEGRVAQVILGEPNQAVRMSIAKMAKLADVSQPTVNRFCRRVGCEGYPDLKMKLAQELASGSEYQVRHVDTELATEAIFTRMFESHLALADDAFQRLGQWPVSTLMDWMLSARRVVVLGGKVEALAAQRLVQALQSIDVEASASLPTLRAPLGPADLVIAMDMTGESSSNTATEALRVKGARLVAVSSTRLSLAREADLCVPLVNDPIDTEQAMIRTQSLLALFVDAVIIAASARRGHAAEGILSEIASAR